MLIKQIKAVELLEININNNKIKSLQLMKRSLWNGMRMLV